MCAQVKNYNTHWRPYWLHCNLCKLKFDFFAKFETLAEDMKTVKGRHNFSKWMKLRNIKLDVAHLGEAGVEFPWANRYISFRSVEASSSLVLIFSTANTLVAITVWWVSCWLSTNEFQYHLMRTKYQPLPTCTDSDKQRHHLVTHGWVFAFQKECQY